MSYRLLIADDEAVERSAVKLMVNKNLQNFEVIGESENGIEAIEHTRELRPDIVLMDIKMPGVNGLTSIAEIRKFDNHVHFVVLSAHNDFEYAQAALKLGADDYLLKPVRFHKLTETLHDIANKLDIAHLKTMQAQHMQSKIESLRPDLEGRIVASITAGISATTLSRYAQFLDIELHNCICIVIRFSKFLAEAERASFLPAFKEALRAICPYFLADFAFDSLVIFLPVDEKWNHERISQWGCELSSFIKNVCKNLGIHPVRIGISHVSENFSALHAAYKQAAQATQQVSLLCENPVEPNNIYRMELKLCELIALGDLDQSLQLFEELFHSYKQQSAENLSVLKARIRDLTIVIKRKLIHELNQSASLNQLVESQLNHLDHLCILADLSELMRVYIAECVALCESNGNGSKCLLDSAVNYITRNFTSSFSLEDLASKLGVSAPYLSRLFKHRLGKNFIDYITELRIQYAKELLSKRDKSIKEITYTVGYNSQTYFCKVFKKVVGISATQYMSQFDGNKL